MIKTKRLLFVIAFAGLTLFAGLFYHQQLMIKVLEKLANSKSPSHAYKQAKIRLHFRGLYNRIIDNISSYDFRIREQKELKKAEKVIINYYLISRSIANVTTKLVEHYGSETTSANVFTVLDNQQFLEEHQEIQSLYHAVKKHRQTLQTSCDDSLQFKMPTQVDFISQFDEVPLAITAHQLALLDQELLEQASQAMKYYAMRIMGGSPYFSMDSCSILIEREQVLTTLANYVETSVK